MTLDPEIIEEDLTFEARPVRILEEADKILRQRTLRYLKVLWSNQTEREATWELESRMREKYPEFFSSGEQLSFLFGLCLFLSKSKEFEDEFC
jgi:hypothetical protein